MEPSASIQTISGVGDVTKELFAKLGVYTVRDILLNFPRNYTQYPKAEPLDDLECLTEGYHAYLVRITRSPVVKATRTMNITLLTLGHTNLSIEFIWYRAPYIKNQLVVGKHYVFYGKTIRKNGAFVMEQPAIYEPEKYQAIDGRIQPVYNLTHKLTNNMVTKTTAAAIDACPLLLDYLPDAIRSRYGLCEYNYAIKQVHFPDSMETLTEARRRLVFDEFFLFILGMQYQKERHPREDNAYPTEDSDYIDKLLEKLPFQLTGAQKAALADIRRDMAGPNRMERLIQGDVGSGKTIVAFLAMARMAEAGYQSAIMAPTEVLAKQHYETFCDYLKTFDLEIPLVLITGSMKQSEKKKAYAKIAEEGPCIVIGTHALIQEKVNYANLGLVITDEQHRFGVRQRETFSDKGRCPHILVMSATPIPRTLAIIIYGDMDISVIDELPANRLPIKNCVVNTSYRPKAYEFIRKEVEKGRQAYVICPLVEETENMDAENVGDYSKKLQKELGTSISVGVLHGKMKSDTKNQVMEDFASCKIQVLVSTTVVEVGVNVPNATVMMIENANHFGLAQLHQLRGRVGRGKEQSYCIMINTSDTKTAKKRLEILNSSNDGFRIASEDLKMRGPGDFFGIRQSGELLFKLGDIYQDAGTLQKASEAVTEILDADPDLMEEKHENLRHEMERYLKDEIARMSL